MEFKSVVGGAAALLLSALPVQAAMVSYYIDQTNADHLNGDLPDGTNYLTVTIDDNGDPGLINFTVDVITGALTDPGGNFGIQKFGFNITGTPNVVSLSAANIVNLPSNWDVTFGATGDGFGSFDVLVYTPITMGPDRADPLMFSIDVTGDTINSYLDQAMNTGSGQSQEDAWFAAHVAGFTSDTYSTTGDTEGVECTPGDPGCTSLVSAWFGGGEGGTPPTAVVPEPLSAALVGTAVLGLVAIRRKLA